MFSVGNRHGTKWFHRQGKINGIQLHWVEAGHHHAPLVLLIHGFPQFWYSWRHQIVRLQEEGFRVVALDLRGINLSDKPARGYDIGTTTQDIRELLRHLGKKRAYVVGHDWGGMVAWAFAARYPNCTSKLTVINTPLHLLRWWSNSSQSLSSTYVPPLSSSSSSSSSTLESPPPLESPPIGMDTWNHMMSSWYSSFWVQFPVLPEAVLSFNRGWILTQLMQARAVDHQKAQNPIEQVVTSLGSCSCTGVSNCGVGSNSCAETTDEKRVFDAETIEIYRNAISRPNTIHCMLEYQRNVSLSAKQMDKYGAIPDWIPIFVVRGLYDRSVRPESDEWLREWVPKSNLTTCYMKCGHFIPEEMPEELNTKLLSFLCHQKVRNYTT